MQTRPSSLPVSPALPLALRWAVATEARPRAEPPVDTLATSTRRFGFDWSCIDRLIRSAFASDADSLHSFYHTTSGTNVCFVAKLRIGLEP